MLKVLPLLLCLCVLTFSTSSAHARRLNLGTQRQLQTRSTYVHSHRVVKEPYREKQPNPNHRIDDDAGNEYILNVGTEMHHCTNLYFHQFLPETATWFSLDVTEGFKMVLQRAVYRAHDVNGAMTDKPMPTIYKEGNVYQQGNIVTLTEDSSSAKRTRPGPEFSKAMIGGTLNFKGSNGKDIASSVIIVDVTSTTQLVTAVAQTVASQAYEIQYGVDGHVYCRVAKPNVPLKLFLMKRREERSRKALRDLASVTSTTAHPPLTWLDTKWYHLPTGPTKAFVAGFCALVQPHGYDGWRNPWDQDEIMICPHSMPKISLDPEFRFCPSRRSTALVAPSKSGVSEILHGSAGLQDPHWDASAKYWITSAIDPPEADTSRFHFFAFNTKPIQPHGKSHSTWDKAVLHNGDISEMVKHDQSQALLTGLCCFVSSVDDLAKRKSVVDIKVVQTLKEADASFENSKKSDPYSSEATNLRAEAQKLRRDALTYDACKLM